MKSMLKAVRSMRSLLVNSVDSVVPETVPTTPPPKSSDNVCATTTSKTSSTNTMTASFKSMRQRKKKKVSPVKPKYEPKKKKRLANTTNVKSLLNHADTRHNLATSFRLNAVGWASVKTPKIFPSLDVVKIVLDVIKRGSLVSLGGIVFIPMMAGVVVKDASEGFVSLNVRVGHVKRDSPAHLKGVTSQHFLHKIRTVSTTRAGRRRYGVMRTVGSREYRNTYTNTIKFDELIGSVDDELARAYVDQKQLEITLVSYIK